MDSKKNIHDVELGENIYIADFVNLYGCKIGDGTKIGTFVEIQRGASIGVNCKISSHTFICEGVSVGNGVFIGHNVSFINDRFPKAVNEDGTLKTSEDWVVEETVVEDGASIGTGATIMSGVRIGRNALVGAGAVVIHDVHDGAVVVGNPARLLYIRENCE